MWAAPFSKKAADGYRQNRRGRGFAETISWSPFICGESCSSACGVFLAVGVQIGVAASDAQPVVRRCVGEYRMRPFAARRRLIWAVTCGGADVHQNFVSTCDHRQPIAFRDCYHGRWIRSTFGNDCRISERRYLLHLCSVLGFTDICISTRRYVVSHILPLDTCMLLQI